MKILFVVQNIDFIDPIGMMMMSALARKKGHRTRLAVISRENLLDRIARLKPDIVAYSASTGEHKYYIEANKAVKARFPHIFTIMGGAHTTFYPECINESTLDAVCMGEGDEAFPELLEALERGHDISGIWNIITRCGPRNGLRPLFEDLDSLPFPDRELFYATTEMGQFPLKSFMASRGCPYPCTYCFNHAFRKLYRGMGKLVRRHSVDYVVEEVAQVKGRYRLDVVKFYDDIFAYRVDDWLEEFVKKYKREIGLPFHCLTRADLMTEDVAKLLKEAGCFSISMSIEAGNPRFRNEVLKRNMTDKQIIRAFHICSKFGIRTFSNNIIGLPYATIQNEIETLDLNLKCKVSYAEFPIFHPYPRTELGDFCIEKGIWEGNYAQLHMSYMNRSPLSCFTEKEKAVQKNLAELGLLVIWFPFLRNLVVKRLIYRPQTRLFLWAYVLAKAYLVRKRVYPVKLKVGDVVRLFRKTFSLETFKHSDEQLPNTKGSPRRSSQYQEL